MKVENNLRYQEYKTADMERLLMGVLNTSLSGLQVFRSVYDPSGNVVDFEWILVNDAVLKTWGKRREEVIGKNLLDIFPGVKKDGLFELYVRAAKGETLNFKQYYNHDGLDRWFNLKAINFQDGFILSSDDITGEVMTEEALKRSHAALEMKVRLRTEQLEKQKEEIYSIFMQAPAIIAILNGPDHRFELANPYYLKAVSRTSDIIGKPVLEVFPELKDQPVWRVLENVYHGAERFIGNEVPMQLDVNMDGTVQDIYFNFVYEPYRDNHGNVKGILVYAMEVTEQVENKKRLDEQNTELIKINQDLDNFIYTASHDLKAPVSNIEGLLHSLKETLTENGNGIHEETGVFLQLMEASINRFKNTILDLTEISKIQKTQEEDVNQIDLYEITQDVKLSIQDKISESGVSIETDFSQVKSLRFSRKNLQSIIYNLLGNAIKYRDFSRPARVIIKTESAADHVLLSVSDNGLGIPEHHLDKIFTMFKRFHDHVEGTGIGLYIVKRIIDNAGGRIMVESEVGRGTTFKVYFKV